MVLGVLVAAVGSAHGSSPSDSQPVQVQVKSSWSGMRALPIADSNGRPVTPPRPDSTEYILTCQVVDCPAAVRQLISIIDSPPKPQFQVSDLASVVSWLRFAGPAEITEANSSVGHALYSAYASPTVRAAFDALRNDPRELDRILVKYYDPSVVWTDDCPHVAATIRLANGSEIRLSSHDRREFMIPWTVTRNGSTYQTYEVGIGRMLAALAPPRFEETDRLAGTHLKYHLLSELFQIALAKGHPAS
jgi:hypothetical protein